MARDGEKKSGPQDAIRRADTDLLVYAILLFQVTAMLMLTLRDSPIDTQALVFAFLMPLVTLVCVKVLPVFWPVDQVLLSLVLFLCSVSVVVLTAISRSPVTPMQQGLYICAGLAGMVFGIVFIRHFRPGRVWRVFLTALSLGLVALPMVIGQKKNGASNWIFFFGGKVSVQPSEFVKLSLCLVLAMTLSRRQSGRMALLSIAFGAALCGVLLVERDLGALLLYFLTTVIVFFIATSNALLSLAGLGAGAAGAVGAYYALPYVQKRVAIWENPWSDPADSGYQVIQSLIAIGSGGLFGMGIGLGIPRSIPLYHSDFVFAAICEQFGMVFAICLLAVYALIVMRGISIAMNCRESFHALLCFGVVTMLSLQTMLIVGGNIRLIPLTGVTLPFVAYGGSSMLSGMIGIGMLMGVSSLNRERDMEELRQRRKKS